MRRARALVLAVLVTGLVAVTSPAEAAPPPNDDFADALVIAAAGGTKTGENEDATGQPGEPDHGQQGWGALHSVWYSWTPTVSEVVPISTCGSSFATAVGVYTGSSLASLAGPSSTKPTSGGPCPGTAWGGLDVAVTAGTTYWIAVDTWGGVDAEGGYEQTDQTTGEFRLLVGAAGAPGATEPETKVTVPDFRPICGTPKTPVTKCPDLQFRLAGKVLTWLKEVRAKGGDVDLVPTGKPSATQDGAVLKYLRSKNAQGSEVLGQSLKPGTYWTTVDQPLRLKFDFFDAFQDAAIAAATLAALDKAGEDNKEVKSPCDYIATDASPTKIISELNRDLGKPGLLTQRDAGALLKRKGCGYEVSEYVDAPGLSQDAVLAVTGVDRTRDLVQLKVGLPVAQDFLMVIREDPEFATTTMLGLGTDGRLTASTSQLSRITVQVLERLTGRLVAGAKVSFYGTEGQPETQQTNSRGEWTFTSRLERAGRYALKAEVVGANGVRMNGFRSIDVVDRGTAPFVTMSGREMTWSNGSWLGTQADVDRARALPVVPANLGTGISAAPSAAPRLTQATVARANGDGTWTPGEMNAVQVLDDTSFAVGAAPGLVAIGGGLDGQVARTARRGWPNPFQAVADAVNYVCTGLARAFDQGAGTVSTVTTQAQQDAIAASAQALAANGAAVPPSGLISDKGLGLISDKGLGVIATGGLNVISTGGLNLRDAQGNLIGQAGGNLIGQAGGNVISNDGASLMPVNGGSLIGQAGGN